MPLRGDRMHRYVNAFCPRCHEEHPDRPLDRGGAAVRLAGRARRPDLARARLPRARAGPHPLRRVARDPALPGAVDRADQGAPAGHAGQLRPAARRPTSTGCREMQTQHTCILLADITDDLQPALPDLLRRLVPGPDRRRRRSTRCWPASTQRLSRENGRIDVLMLSGGEPTLLPRAGGAARRGRAAQRRAGPRQHQRGAARPRRRAARPAGAPPRAGRGLPAVRRGQRGGAAGTTAARTCAAQGPTPCAAVGPGHLHHAHHDGRARRQRRRDRRRAPASRWTRPYVGGVSHPAAVRLRPVRRHRPDGPAHPHRRAGPAGPADRWPGHLARPHRAAVLAPALLLRRLPAARRRRASGGRSCRLVGHDRLLEFLDLAPDASPTGSPTCEIPRQVRAAVKESLLGLLSEQSSLSHPRVGDLWRDICEKLRPRHLLAAALASPALPGGGPLRRMLGERVKRITVKPFMDISTMIEERLTQCCVHVGTRARATGPVRAVLRRAGLAGSCRRSGCRWPPVAGRCRWR